MADINYSSVVDVGKMIADELAQYSKQVTDSIKISIDEVATETVQILKENSPKRYGKYAKGWTSKTVFENGFEKRNKIYNKVYQLTHLLEFGHIKKDGGRTKAFNHIKKAEEIAIKKIEQKVIKAVEDAYSL